MGPGLGSISPESDNNSMYKWLTDESRFTLVQIKDDINWESKFVLKCKSSDELILRCDAIFRPIWDFLQSL